MKILPGLSLIVVIFLSSQPTTAQFHVDTLFRAPDIAFPTTLAFPDDGSGRLFFTQKNSGRVRLAQNDSLRSTPFVTVGVSTNSERGLLGVACHPQFADSPFVYIYYTRSSDQRNQIVRYEVSGETGVNPETLFVTPIASQPNHNAGNIHFGPDGKLYVTIGDFQNPPNSQDTSNTTKPGKIHRFNADGSIPADNPFPGNSLYAYGLRNSFDFTFDVITGNCYATENGPSCNDEINRILPGRNYGWPDEGNCTYSGDPQYTAPLYYWPSALPSFTGIHFYRSSVIPELTNQLLVTAFNTGTVYKFGLSVDGDSITSGPTPVISFAGGLTDIEAGPDGFLYVVNGDFSGHSYIFRLRPVAPPGVPTLSLPANGSINLSTSPLLQWTGSPGATAYEIQVGIDSTFSSGIVVDSIITDTDLQLPQLQTSTQHFWRVRAGNGDGWSSYSEHWRFTTTALSTPLLEGVFGPSTGPQFRWHPSPGAPAYEMQLALDTGFSSIVYIDSSISDTSSSTGGLANGTKYYFRVRAKDGGAASNWSRALVFLALAGKEVSTYTFESDWNLLSLPLAVDDPRVGTLFPQATSAAFAYDHGYASVESLRLGSGYWLKFAEGHVITFTGVMNTADTIHVLAGWSMVGPVSSPYPVSSITTDPPGILEGNFFEFNGGYLPVDTLLPAKGYWIKVSADGNIILQ